MPVQATGGTVVDINDGGVDYRVHTFTSDGNLVVTSGGDVEYLIAAGGGNGGNMAWGGAGGGAGGDALVGTTSVTAQTYSIVVGAGAPQREHTVSLANFLPGGNSSAFGVEALGGGRGAGRGHSGDTGGGSGGYLATLGGGGGGTDAAGGAEILATDVQQGVAHPTGFSGGDGNAGDDPQRAGGGGRGAGGSGGSSSVSGGVGTAGDGGIGVFSTITGTSVEYGIGGAGSSASETATPASPNGLVDGINNSQDGVDGIDGLGSGGSGATGTGVPPVLGGAGGDGVIIVRYATLEAAVSPVISSGEVINRTTDGFQLRFTTDTANGTAYYVVYPTTATDPDEDQIQDGDDGDDNPALRSGSQPVTDTGVHTFPAITGLSVGTYRYAIVHFGNAE